MAVNKKFEDKFYPVKGLENETCGKTDEEIAALTATLSAYLLEQSFPCRYETISFEPGSVHMDGETALKFARSRHSDTDGSDFARSNRQKAILQATLDKVLSAGFVTQAIPFVRSLTGSLRTDIDITTLQKYLGRVSEIKDYRITSLSLNTDNIFVETYSTDGQYVLLPKNNDWEAVHTFISEKLK